MRNRFSKVRGRHGFSLIELLVVLVILALLGSIVGPRVMKHVGRAKSETARMQIEDLSSALDVYQLDVGSYPSADQGLEALIRAPAGAANWNGPYLKKERVPRDPWGRPYEYRAPGEHGDVDILSFGADGSPGGDGEARDIASWE